jgi:hypothetical protein
MRILNIVTITDGINIIVTSYPMADEFNEKEIIEQAEIDFLTVCREMGADEEECSDDYLLEEGVFRESNNKAYLTWSEINL